jgi:HD-GYP domain-containing protein (c-di-GMP phosphodiesterase class II)
VPTADPIRRDRLRTILALVVLQGVVLAIGWGWSMAQNQHQVPLSIGTGVFVLLVTAWGTARLVRSHDRGLERANSDLARLNSELGRVNEQLFGVNQELTRVNANLERLVADRVSQATATRDALITGLARLADYRDSDTGAHLDRIAEYCAILGEHLRATHPTWGEQITPDWIARLRVASSLHDIGKVGVGDAILLKPAGLDDGERRAMQRHPVIGANTLLAVREAMGRDELVEMAMRVTLFHHERWDGTGYPTGLAGDDIPLEARIVAVADVYDALTSARVYKEAMSHGEAAAILRASAATHLDPEVVAAFDACAPRFDEARQRLRAGSEAGGDVLDRYRRVERM